MLQFGQAWVTSFILSINSGIMQQGTQPIMQRNPERIHCKPEISFLTSVVMFDSQLWHFILTASLLKLEQWPPEKTKFDHNIFGTLFLFSAPWLYDRQHSTFCSFFNQPQHRSAISILELSCEGKEMFWHIIELSKILTGYGVYSHVFDILSFMITGQNWTYCWTLWKKGSH